MANSPSDSRPVTTRLPEKSPRLGALDSLRTRVNRLDLPKPVIAVVAVILVAGALFIGLKSRPTPIVASTNLGFQAETADIVWLRAKVRETGGVISRLSAPERAKADEAARRITGMSATALFGNQNALAKMDPNKFQESRTAVWRATQKR